MSTTSGQLNRQQIARLLDVSLATIDAWVSDGMPAIQRGRRGIRCAFDIAACIKWVRERDAARMRQRIERLEARHARRYSGPYDGVELARAFVVDLEGPLLSVDQAGLCELLGWSAEDVLEARAWGMPFIPVPDGKPVTFAPAVCLRWLGLLAAALQHNGASAGDFVSMTAALRRLRLAAGLTRFVPSEVLPVSAAIERLASLAPEGEG